MSRLPPISGISGTSGIDRRSFLDVGLRVGSSALLGALSARWLTGSAHAKASPAGAGARAQACIVLWLNGGPSHLDTFDPKPGTATGGPFKAISTKIKGVSLCEHLPGLAEQAQHLAVIRGLTSKEGNHQRAQFLLHTGYSPNPTVDHPGLGSWISEELADPAFALPSFVTIKGPSIGAGFLGVQHGPFVVQEPGKPPENTNYPREVDFVRFLRRKSALAYLETHFQGETADLKVKERQTVADKAVRMMYAPKLKAFELADEPDALRAAYGDNDFGKGCLLARRLVQAGVKYVEVVLDGWDTHKDNFEKTTALMRTLDPAMSTLLRDLDERKMLHSTLILCMGEFGRTPQINPNDGRDHYPQAFSALLAGGGVRGGIVYGQTDAEGRNVVEKPVKVPDLFATATTLLGIDPDKEFSTPLGRPVTITDNGQPIPELMM